MANRSRWYWTRRVKPAGWVVLPPVLAAIAFAAYRLVSHVVLPGFMFVVHHFDVWSRPALYALVGFMVAGVLALLRGESRGWYGFIEICFACVGLAATAVLANSKDMFSLSNSYIGSVYVLIRGFTNVWETLSDERKQKIRVRFYRDEA